MGKKSWLKVILIIAGFFIFCKVLILVAVEPLLKIKIENYSKTEKSPFAAEIEDLDISLFPPGICLNEIKILPVTHVGNNIRNSELISGTIREVSIKGIKFFRALFDQEYFIDQFSISGVRVAVTHASAEQKSDEAKTEKIIFPLTLHINKSSLENIYLSFNDLSKTKKYRTADIQNLNIFFDSLSFKKNYPVTADFCSSLRGEANRIAIVTQDSLYTWTADHIKAGASSLSADSIMSLPNYSYYEFTGRNEFQTDRINMILSKAVIENFDLKEYLLTKKINADFLQIAGVNADIFRDKRVKGSHKKKPMVQEVLREYAYPLKIDSVLIERGNIKYTEHAVKANKPGKIYFSEMKIRLYNITNDTSVSQLAMKLESEAKLMGKSKLRISVSWNMNDAQSSFTCSGSVDPMNIEDLNPMLERNAFIYADGKIKKMEFNFKADRVKSGGKMMLLYDNLKITSKNKGSDDTTAVKEKIVSFIANNIICLPSNPMPGKPVREGIIDWERIPDRFFFNYCWKSILSGIKSSIEKPSKKKNSKKEKKNK